MPRNKYPKETEQKILDVAFKLFIEKGYENTTIIDIVNNLGGLTRGAFYHHFKSKEEVLDLLTDKMFDVNNPFEKVKKLKHLNGLEKFRYIVAHNFDNPEVNKLNVSAVHALNSPTFLKKFIDDNRDVLPVLYKQLIDEGVQDGSIKTEHSKLLSEVFTMLTNFWMVPTIYPSTPQEIMEKILYIKEITDKMGFPLLDDETLKLIFQGRTNYID